MIPVITGIGGDVDSVGDRPRIPFTQVKSLFQRDVDAILFPAGNGRKTSDRVFEQAWKFKITKCKRDGLFRVQDTFVTNVRFLLLHNIMGVGLNLMTFL